MAAQSELKEERINAAFMLALGRKPDAPEMDRWRNEKAGSVAELVTALDQQLDASAQRAVRTRAWSDVFGPEAPAADQAGDTAANYAVLAKRHVAWLTEHRDAYAQVLARAYRDVLGRDPYEVEVKYWQEKPVVSFVLLTGCLENWARRNQPGLMVTAGTPTISASSHFFTAVTLSRAVAAEARAASVLQPDGNPDLAAAVGRNVIAAGGGSVASNGGIAMVVAGKPPA